MHITKVQLSQLIANHPQRENGLNEVMEMTLNGMMKAERNAFLEESAVNKGNGYRPGKVYGYGKLLELRIPLGPNREFHLQIWTLLRRRAGKSCSSNCTAAEVAMGIPYSLEVNKGSTKRSTFLCKSGLYEQITDIIA